MNVSERVTSTDEPAREAPPKPPAHAEGTERHVSFSGIAAVEAPRRAATYETPTSPPAPDEAGETLAHRQERPTARPPTMTAYAKSGLRPPSLTLTRPRAVPRVLRALDSLLALPLDNRMAFVLSHVDGRRTVEDVIDACGLPEHEVRELLLVLVAHDVVSLE